MLLDGGGRGAGGGGVGVGAGAGGGKERYTDSSCLTRASFLANVCSCALLNVLSLVINLLAVGQELNEYQFSLALYPADIRYVEPTSSKGAPSST